MNATSIETEVAHLKDRLVLLERAVLDMDTDLERVNARLRALESHNQASLNPRPRWPA